MEINGVCHNPFMLKVMNEFDQHYHSNVPLGLTKVINEAPLMRFAAPHAAYDRNVHFIVSFQTSVFVPNHKITLRNNIDGWERDIHGQYDYGEWKFVLRQDSYPEGLEFKFLLDGRHWMLGGNLRLFSPVPWIFKDQDVRFDPVPARFPLPFDCLRVQENDEQQQRIRSDYSSSTEHEVIIIGSGISGGVLADELSDKGIRTLVLDAGSLDIPTHVYNLPGNDGNDAYLRNQVWHWTREDWTNSEFGSGVSMNFGGRSVFWSGLIPRMQDWEMDAWPESVRQYLKGAGYPRAEKLMRKAISWGPYQESVINQLATVFPDWNVGSTPFSLDQPELGSVSGTIPESLIDRSTGTFSSAELLLDSLTTGGTPGRDYLRINLNHLVTHIRHAGGMATEVVCQDLIANTERIYKARHVVIAAGSMESVRIALQSNLHDPQRRIGWAFTDHPSYFVGHDTQIFLNEGSLWAGREKHARIFFSPKQAIDGHFFNIEIVINGRYWRERHADDEVRDMMHGERRTTINFKFVFNSPLVMSNQIHLGDDGRKLKVRIPANNYAAGAEGTVKDMCRKLMIFFGTQQIDLNDRQYFHYGNGGTPHHAGGSMRMAENGNGVVTPELNVEGYENLYVCDASVFPSIPAANPSLTVVALAQRLADRLIQKLRPQQPVES